MAILSCDGRSERPGKNDVIFSLVEDGGSEVDSKLALKDSLSCLPKGERISLSELEEILEDNDFGIDSIVTGADEIVFIDEGPDFVFGAGKVPEDQEYIIRCEDTEYKTPKFVDVEGNGFFSCLTGGSAYDFQRSSESIPQQTYVVSDSVNEKFSNPSILCDSDCVVGGHIGMGRSVVSQADARRRDQKRQRGTFAFFKGKRIVYKPKKVSHADGEKGEITMVPQEHDIDGYWKFLHRKQIRSQRRLIMSREFALG